MASRQRLISQANTNSFRESISDLKRWGRYIRDKIYYHSSPTCTLPKLIEYGVNIPTGYYSNIPLPDPRVTQTQRVWAFMPQKMREVVFSEFVLDGERAFKARRVGVKQPMYYYYYNRGIDFYDKYRGTDFFCFDLIYVSNTI